jgi:predicted ABC-type ATPase
VQGALEASRDPILEAGFPERARRLFEEAARGAADELHRRGQAVHAWVGGAVVTLAPFEPGEGGERAGSAPAAVEAPGRWFWLLAGGSGAGKSTLSRTGALSRLLGPIPVFNQPEGPGFVHRGAGAPPETVAASVQDCFRRGESFAFEAVAGGNKQKPLLDLARAHGFRFGLLYLALSSPQLAVQRHRDAGKRKPEEKIRKRWRRSLEKLPALAARADRVVVLGNDDPRHTRLVASGAGGRVDLHDADWCPQLSRRLRRGGAR